MKEIRTRKVESLLLLRTKMGLTQGEMANLLGISQATYSNKEAGRTPITVPEALKILEISGGKFEDIFLPEDYEHLVVDTGGAVIQPVPGSPGAFKVRIKDKDKEGKADVS